MMDLIDEQYAEIDYHNHHISVAMWEDEHDVVFFAFVDGKDAMIGFSSVDHAVNVSRKMLDEFGRRLRPGWGIWWSEAKAWRTSPSDIVLLHPELLEMH